MLNQLLIRQAVCGGILALAATCVSAQNWNPDPALGNVEQHRRLYDIARRYCEKNYDAEANLVYTPGQKLHSTRESAYYAYGLLLTGDSADNARAQAILKRILTVQDTRVESRTYGDFNWTFEDPAPRDPNSRVFIGLILADIIDMDRAKPMLDSDLRQEVEKACRRTVEAAIRHNVSPGYTNIALLSVALTAAGEKLWSIPEARAFSQRKLESIIAVTGDGEFTEFLSPTYYGVSIHAAYSARKYAFSEAFAAKMDGVIDHLWKQNAASYHAPTFQLAGPQYRSYGNNMLEYAAVLKYVLYLALNGDYPLPDSNDNHGWDKACLFAIAALPIPPRPEFKNPVPAWREWTVAGLGPKRKLQQFRDGNFILGTVDFMGQYGDQKRNLVAYWRTDEATPGAFHVGYCMDQSNNFFPWSRNFPGDKISFFSHQVRDAALVAMVAPTERPPESACSMLVFDRAAKVEFGTETSPVRIRDGVMTAYLYPVSHKAVTYETTTDKNVLRITRPWSDADSVNSVPTLAYLIVFRPSDQTLPNVSNLSLGGETDDYIARAKVDGTDLKVMMK